MDVFIMKYVTIGFAFMLVLITILFIRSRFGRFKFFAKLYTPKSVFIHGLSAFFVLCYSQCARVTFQILNYFCLFSANLSCEAKVVYRSGHLDYLGPEHLKYALVAIFFLVFIVIMPPLLLLLYPLMFKILGMCKLSESRLFSILWRVMPIQLLDSFQSAFKDNCRFFAGLYFLNRAVALATYAYCRTLLQFFIVLQIQLILVLALHAIFQPYKEKRHNIIDSLFFTNLSIINGLTLFNYSSVAYGKNKPLSINTNDTASVIQTVLIYIPLLGVLLLGIEQLVIRWKGWRNSKKKELLNDLPSLRDSKEDLHYMHF